MKNAKHRKPFALVSTIIAILCTEFVQIDAAAQHRQLFAGTGHGNTGVNPDLNAFARAVEGRIFYEGGQEPTSVESMIGSAGMAKLRQQNGDMNPNSRYYYLGNSRHPTPNLDTFARTPSKAYFGGNLDPPVDRDTIYDYGDQQPQFQLGYQDAKNDDAIEPVYTEMEMRRELERQLADDAIEREQLAAEALEKANQQQANNYYYIPTTVDEDGEGQVVVERLREFGRELSNSNLRAERENNGSKGKVLETKKPTKPIVQSGERELVDKASMDGQQTTKPGKKPAKKGQYEFVEFIEPSLNAKLRGIESMEKRVPMDEFQDDSSHFNLFVNSGNLLFLAAVATCCVMAAIGVTGGVYYYNRVRAARDDPFDEFMRYSPTGPGRDKLKKAHLPPSHRVQSPGDENLAYKAQLQHYRQTKQKIIGAPNGLPADHIQTYSEDEEDYDQNNFSVYECPGLAPTGDIEVQNPNFVGSTKSASPTPSQSSSVHE